MVNSYRYKTQLSCYNIPVKKALCTCTGLFIKVLFEHVQQKKWILKSGRLDIVSVYFPVLNRKKKEAVLLCYRAHWCISVNICSWQWRHIWHFLISLCFRVNKTVGMRNLSIPTIVLSFLMILQKRICIHLYLICISYFPKW